MGTTGSDGDAVGGQALRNVAPQVGLGFGSSRFSDVGFRL